MGAGGFVVLLALAMPAFQITTGDWRSQGDFAVTFLDRYGNEIGQRGIIQRDSVPVDEMPDHVIKAVLATEDRRFFEHYGIDVLGLSRAIFENVRANSVVQGGSSITQQLAKNLFLSNERTLQRKIKEAFLALWLEANLSKKEILQLYLDRAYMGGGTFGIEAAADFYFGKSVKDLNLAEAAMLAGLFKAPTKYAPHINLPAARARANVVLTNLVQCRLHDRRPGVAGAAASGRDRRPRRAEEPGLFPRLGLRRGQEDRQARPAFDGRPHHVRHANMQKAAEESVEFHLRQFGKEYNVTEGAVVVIETNGAVRAIVGGRDYGASQFNRATKALRQTGSSFKPYVYATAMEHGFTPNSVVSDGPISWGGWSPHNYNGGSAGNVTLITAIAKSINTVPVRLAKDYLGIPPIKAMAEIDGRGIAAGVAQDHGARHIGHDGHGPGDGLQRVRAERLRRLAARHHPARHPHRRCRLRLGQGCAGAASRACREQALKYMNTDAGGRCRRSARRGAPRCPTSLGRQDRHDAVLPRRLVCRLHRQLHGRRLARQ